MKHRWLSLFILLLFATAYGYLSPLSGGGGGGVAGDQTANTIYAGPESGSPAPAAFRVLSATDIPTLDAARIGSGILLPAQGGTGAGILTTGRIPYIGTAGVYTVVSNLSYDAGNGRVGIGTPTPGKRMQINGSGDDLTSAGIQINNSNNSGTFAASIINLAANANSGYIQCTSSLYTPISAMTDRCAFGVDSSSSGIIMYAPQAAQDIRFIAGGTTPNKMIIATNGVGIGIGNTAPASATHLGGSLQFGFATISASAAIDAHSMISCNATAGTVVLTLPLCTNTIAGRTYRAKKTDASGNNCEFARAGSDTMNRAPTNLVIGSGASGTTIVCVGASNWQTF